MTFLVIYWAVFFRKFLRNPYLLSTSELASTYFPHWVWMGKEMRAGRFPFRDKGYYLFPGAVSFLSTFYPPNLLSSLVANFLDIDASFRVFTWLILGHYLVGSYLAFVMFHQWASPVASLYGAILLTYSAYQIKPQTPEYAFTMMWVPGILIKGWIGKLSVGMALLGGYYPPLVYVLPFALLANPGAIWGIFIGLPQLIPFLWYWKKSVRDGQTVENQGGSIGFKELLSRLYLPWDSQIPSKGIHYPEFACYMSLLPFFFIRHWSWWLLPLAYSVLVLLGVLPSIQRIPARALYLLTFSITCLAVQGVQAWHLSGAIIILQAWLLCRNADIYPSSPFSQWWNRPSRLYAKRYDHTKWPFFTGYLWNGKTDGYRGAFRLKESEWKILSV